MASPQSLRSGGEAIASWLLWWARGRVALLCCTGTACSTSGLAVVLSVPLRALVVDSSHLNGGAFHSSGRKSGHSISSRSSRASACLVMAPHSTNVLTIAWTSRWVKRSFPVPCSFWLKTYGLSPIALPCFSCVPSVVGRKYRTFTRNRSTLIFVHNFPLFPH